MKLGVNVFAGLAGSAWTALLTLAVVPVYLRYLGVEAYGLIGFFVTMQVVLQLLDAGLAATINREVARRTSAGEHGEARILLHTVAVIYWASAAIIGLLVVAAAPLIASHWLRSSAIDVTVLKHSVVLMGLAIACRWPVALYQGALMGAQRLAVASALQIVMASIGHGGAVLLLIFWWPTIEVFFVWHAAAALGHALLLRWAAWRVLEGYRGERFDKTVLRHIWRFSAGMSGTAVAAMLLTQMDKVVLSRMLSLEDFGRYTVAALVASGLYLLITPVFNATYPRFSALVSRAQTEELVSLYRAGTRLFCSVLFPVAFGIAVFAEDFLAVWTGNSELAKAASPLTALLVMGTALNGVMHFPYALQLAHGLVRLPLLAASALAVTMVPLIIYLASTYGPIGGAAAWLLVNLAYLFFGTWLTHRRLLKGMGGRWLLTDVGLPMVLALVLIGGGATILGKALHSHWLSLLWAAALVGTTATLAVLAFPEFRGFLRRYLAR